MQIGQKSQNLNQFEKWDEFGGNSQPHWNINAVERNYSTVDKIYSKDDFLAITKFSASQLTLY